MRAVLDPLLAIPGVRVAMLVGADGVPIVVRGGSHGVDARQGDEEIGELGGLSAGWLSEISRAIAPLSWGEPQHLVLRASRGTLIAVQAPRALLLVVLEGGMQPEELRLPMEAAVARLQRGLRSGPGAARGEKISKEQVPGIFPARSTSPESGANAIHATRDGAEAASGE